MVKWHGNAKGNNLRTHKSKGRLYYYEWKCFGMNKESQGATSTICSNEQYYRGKKIDKIKISKSACKDSPRRSTQTRMSMKQTYRYCRSHPPRQCLAFGEMCKECKKIGHCRVVYSSRRIRAMNEVEQETVHNDAWENVELENINSIQLNKNCSVFNGQFTNVSRSEQYNGTI